MKKLLLACAVCFCVFTSMITKTNNSSSGSLSNNRSGSLFSASDNNSAVIYWIDSLYTKLQLSEAGLNRDAFINACKGYQYLLLENQISRPGLLTICDYSQSSSSKRLYILDLNKGAIIFNTYVAHGRNSGNDEAESFSNRNDSHKSCLGFLITAETYIGDNGYSLRLDGMEKGFNDNARPRAIVMHGSDYVSRERAINGTMMGRSYGCPAVPIAEAKKIIDCIKGGSCLFNYYPDTRYAQTSSILNSDFVWPVLQTLQLASVKLPDTLTKFDVFSDFN